MKSYNDKIATYGVLIAVIAIVVSLATPEIRTFIGLEKSKIETAKYNAESFQKAGKKKASDISKETEILTPSPFEKKIFSSERLNESKTTMIDVKSKRQYFSIVKNTNGKGITDIEIYCPNCIVKKVKTDEEGSFHLEGYFDENETFWQSTLTFSKGTNSKTETINWREKSPQPIKF